MYSPIDGKRWKGRNNAVHSPVLRGHAVQNLHSSRLTQIVVFRNPKQEVFVMRPTMTILVMMQGILPNLWQGKRSFAMKRSVDQETPQLAVSAEANRHRAKQTRLNSGKTQIKSCKTVKHEAKARTKRTEKRQSVLQLMKTSLHKVLKCNWKKQRPTRLCAYPGVHSLQTE